MTARFLSIFMACALAIAACSTDGDRVAIDDFVRVAQAHGWKMQPAGTGAENHKRLHYIVNPGEMRVALECHADARSARAAAGANNQDIVAIRKHVERDGIALSEMGEQPQAFSRDNLVLYVPLNYVVFYPEAAEFIALFEKFSSSIRPQERP